MSRSRHRRPAEATRSRLPPQPRRSRKRPRRLPGQEEARSPDRPRAGAEGERLPEIDAVDARRARQVTSSHPQGATWSATPSTTATSSTPHDRADDEEHDKDRDTDAATATAMQEHAGHRARIRPAPLPRSSRAASATQVRSPGVVPLGRWPLSRVRKRALSRAVAGRATVPRVGAPQQRPSESSAGSSIVG